MRERVEERKRRGRDERMERHGGEKEKGIGGEGKREGRKEVEGRWIGREKWRNEGYGKGMSKGGREGDTE